MKNPKIEVECEQLYVNDNYEECQKEIKLWRAVINQALEDLNLSPTNKRYKKWKLEAVEWFSKDNQDFYIVCENAKLSPEKILNFAKELINKK